MNYEGLVAYLNILSRWALFLAITYKAWKTEEKGWILLSTAFFINALDIESYILNPLGIHVLPDAYVIASKIPNFAITILLLWGTLHLKHKETEPYHVVALSIVSVIAYLWLFLLATDAFGGNFALQSSIPSLFYGGSLIYFGVVLWRHVISKNVLDRLFPLGLILLGALNLTYPLTREIEWFVPIGFTLGAAFRLTAAGGALKFAFYEILPQRTWTEEEEKRGAFIVIPSNLEGKLKEMMTKPGTVLITRASPSKLRNTLPPDSVAFWTTRVREGKLEDNPTIYAVSPTKLGILTDLVAKAIERGYKRVYLDAFEYLAVENGFENAFKFLLSIKDRVLSAKGIMLVVVDPEALSPREVKLLEKEFKKME